MPNKPDNSQSSSRSAQNPGAPHQSLKRDLYERRRWVRGGLLALLVLDGLFLFFSFRPLGLSASQQNDDLQSLREEAKGKRETVARLRKIESTLGESNRLGDQFYQSKFLPAESGFGTIMEEVEKLAVANGVRKGTVSYGVQEIKDRPDLEEVSIDTTLEGDYAKIVRFVNQLEQSPLFLIVDNMGVSAGGKNKSISVNVKLLTLFRVPKGSPISEAGKTLAQASEAPVDAGQASGQASGKTGGK
jgi:Tfp pilus assembly protein PilO